MSSSFCRSVSGSRSQASIGTSYASRRSVNVSYHQIALELINGGPLDLVTKRDLRNVLIELSILRSEANGLKNYVLSDQIKDIIVALNQRVTPPPIRKTANTTPKGSTIDQSEFLETPKENNDENDKTNSPPHFTPTISKNTNEFNDISIKIDALIEALHNNTFEKTLKQQKYDELDYHKYVFVINERKEKYLKEFKYRSLKSLDILLDKLRPLPYDPRAERYEERIEQLKTRIEMSRCKASLAEVEKCARVQNLQKEKEKELQKLEEEHQNKMKELDESLTSKSQIAINHQSKALKQMRMNERSAALSRDYEGAEKIHRNADIKEAEEKEEILLRYEETRSRNREQLEKTQKAQIDCMEQHYNYLILKKEITCNKDINKYSAAIEAAKRQITFIEEKRKKLPKSSKHPTD